MFTGWVLAVIACLAFMALVYGGYRLECWLQGCVPEEARDRRYCETEQYQASVRHPARLIEPQPQTDLQRKADFTNFL